MWRRVLKKPRPDLAPLDDHRTQVIVRIHLGVHFTQLADHALPVAVVGLPSSRMTLGERLSVSQVPRRPAQSVTELHVVGVIWQHRKPGATGRLSKRGHRPRTVVCRVIELYAVLRHPCDIQPNHPVVWLRCHLYGVLRATQILHGHTVGHIGCPEVLLAEPRHQIPLEQCKPHRHDGEGESSVLGPVRPGIGVAETGHHQQQKEQHVQPAAGIHPVEGRKSRGNSAPDGGLLALLLPGLPVEPLRLGTTLLAVRLGITVRRVLELLVCETEASTHQHENDESHDVLKSKFHDRPPLE